ncbi:hypothetical protein [Mesorhizobium sp. Cs1299R1N3]
MKKAKVDALFEEFRDLLHECPEAERALRDYRAPQWTVDGRSPRSDTRA